MYQKSTFLHASGCKASPLLGLVVLSHRSRPEVGCALVTQF
jgi:hypothetical protein